MYPWLTRVTTVLDMAYFLPVSVLQCLEVPLIRTSRLIWFELVQALCYDIDMGVSGADSGRR